MAFFEKVGETFSNAFEASTLSSQLKICEDTLKKNYAEIGRLFYEQNKDNIPAGYEQSFAKVKESLAAVAETGEKLREVKNVKACPSCGAEIGLAVKFCPKCGTECEVIPVSEAKVDNGKCPGCGAKLKPGASFCNNCGMKVN